MKNIKVSICCITYNQEKYIEQAINSFLSQKTNFDYEIIIHDDASNDETVNILTKYQKKYPDKIVLMLEKENQYSKCANSVLVKVLDKAKGKYIALCDGDDFWCDDNKLQKQVDYMDLHKNISLCSHNTEIINENNEKIDLINSYLEGIVTIENFLSNNSSMHTSSMLFRKKDVLKLPNYYYEATVGDLPLKLHLLSKGNCYHFNNVMSCYRTNAINSWSVAQKNNDIVKHKNFEMEIQVYNSFNKETKYVYDDLIKNKILYRSFCYFKDKNDLNEIKKEKYAKYYKKLSLNEKIKLQLKNSKVIYKLYSKLKKVLHERKKL